MHKDTGVFSRACLYLSSLSSRTCANYQISSAAGLSDFVEASVLEVEGAMKNKKAPKAKAQPKGGANPKHPAPDGRGDEEPERLGSVTRARVPMEFPKIRGLCRRVQ